MFILLGATQQTQGPRATTATMGRATMSLQPVSSVQNLVRTQSPSNSQPGTLNNVRAPSPAGTPRTVVSARSTIPGGKPTQSRSEVTRPIVLPSAPARPLTLTPTTQVSYFKAQVDFKCCLLLIIIIGLCFLDTYSHR